ncbi:MAG TPA: hypothetical protein VFX44_06600 [Solirubrobacterales bacterium]|nr:hypothetical protein [Solirubrobacterales bacterium]
MNTGRTVGGARNVGLANLGLLIPNGTKVSITGEGLSFSDPGIQLQRGERQGYSLRPESGAVAVSLQPPAAGRLDFPAEWQAFELFALCRDDFSSIEPVRGGELRYFHGPEGGKTFSYPLFEAIPSEDEGMLALDVELDPLAPFDGERTRMLFREAPKVLGSAGGYGTGGEAVTLTPLAEGEGRAGLYFGRRPGESGQPAVYLAPLGSFELGLEKGKEGEVRLMCGTSGLEYLAAATGDRLVFVPGQPAFAPSFESKSGNESGEPLLQPPFTTSWVEFAPQGQNTGKRAYFGQPEASPNYGHGILPSRGGKTMTLPAAVASRVRGLANGSNPFPLALYGEALSAGEAEAPVVEDLMAFENFALAPERGAQLRHSAPPGELAAGAESPPVPPVFSDATGAPLKGGKTATPQGFVVGLNDGSGDPAPGTWQEVQFARGSSSSQVLTVPAGSEGVVDPWLSTSLVKDQLFMVLNDWSKLPALDWLLSVGGFEFRMAPKAEELASDGGKTVLVFKFATSQSLAELIPTTSAWSLKERFVGEEGKVTQTREALEKALEVAEEAKGRPNDPFEHFREIAHRADWTGMLAFQCLLPGTGMPPDLQMLYAGIEGKLRAHHFGVELNRITRSEGKAEIAESSLFGAIYYQGTPKQPESTTEFEFTLRELEVTIRNSAVTEFHATVLLRANELFGREVALSPATEVPNTITLTGQYQRHGAVGTVTFALADPKEAVFDFSGSDLPAPPVRVLEAISVTGASLVPVTTSDSSKGLKGQPEAKEITAQVALEGGLRFAEAPIPGAPGLDLFSYGAPGIGFSGFGLRVSCTIYSDGTKSPTAIKPDLSAVVLRDPGESARRPEGLVSKLPLTLKGLLHDEGAGLDPTKLGALPVNVIELAGPQGRTAPSPRYALQFSLPLGTLGSLADAHASLEATLILGWGPSSYVPDDDGIGVFVQLPFISAGAFGLDLQGLLKTTFGDANLMRVETKTEGPTYVVLFNNIAISVLGMKFPPRVIVDFILFAGPGTGGTGNLGWSLAAAEPASKAQATLTERTG